MNQFLPPITEIVISYPIYTISFTGIFLSIRRLRNSIKRVYYEILIFPIFDWYIQDLTDNIIKNKRDELNLGLLTHYIVMDVEDLNVFKYRQNVIENRQKYHPTKDERTCPESHLVCSSKFELVLKTIELNPFNTSKFGWIDSNVGGYNKLYERNTCM